MASLDTVCAANSREVFLVSLGSLVLLFLADIGYQLWSAADQSSMFRMLVLLCIRRIPRTDRICSHRCNSPCYYFERVRSCTGHSQKYFIAHQRKKAKVDVLKADANVSHLSVHLLISARHSYHQLALNKEFLLLERNWSWKFRLYARRYSLSIANHPSSKYIVKGVANVGANYFKMIQFDCICMNQFLSLTCLNSR